MNPPQTPADRVRVISLSLKTFFFGIIALVPVLGMPFAVRAIFNCARLAKDRWNPAAHYSRAGAVLAVAGLVFTLACFAILAIAIENQWIGSITTTACQTSHG